MNDLKRERVDTEENLNHILYSADAGEIVWRLRGGQRSNAILRSGRNCNRDGLTEELNDMERWHKGHNQRRLFCGKMLPNSHLLRTSTRSERYTAKSGNDEARKGNPSLISHGSQQIIPSGHCKGRRKLLAFLPLLKHPHYAPSYDDRVNGTCENG
jgi:hypothetical protein